MKVLIVLLLLLFGFLAVWSDSGSSKREIEEHINWRLIESLYGKRFDALKALGALESRKEFNSEIERLREVFLNDPLVTSLYVYDQRFSNLLDDTRIYFVGDDLRGGCSSSGLVAWHHERMMRCTRFDENKGNIQTMMYRRESISIEDEVLTRIEIHFDYLELAHSYTLEKAESANALSDEVKQQNDQRVFGQWAINQRSRLTANESIEQRGVMTVGPRLASGSYQVTAQIEAHVRLREGRTEFSVDHCKSAIGVCIWNTSVSGRLKIIGNRTLLTFDDRFWLSDRLDIENDVMHGRDDWGNVTVFNKIR